MKDPAHLNSVKPVYHPFGMLLTGRCWKAGSGYRYGFQNQELESEIYNGAVSYSLRVNDVRIGRFLSLDPLEAKFAYNSPYTFSENRLIDVKELEGAETNLFERNYEYDRNYKLGYSTKEYIEIRQKEGWGMAMSLSIGIGGGITLAYRGLAGLAIYLSEETLETISGHPVIIPDPGDAPQYLAKKQIVDLNSKIPMTITKETPLDQYPTIRSNLAEVKYKMPTLEREYVDFNEPVYNSLFTTNSTLYQYRRKTTDGSVNSTMGSYFVSDPAISAEMVGLRTKDYDLYKVTLSNTTEFFTATHKKNSKVYYNIDGPQVEGGGTLFYKQNVSGTAEKIK